MHVAVFALTRAARQPHGHRGVVGGQAVELVAHIVEIVEAVQALTAGVQFGQGLRAAKQQQAQQDPLCCGHMQRRVEPVRPTLGAGAVFAAGQSALFQMAQGLADPARIEFHYRSTAGLLIAGRHGRIQGQRVGLGRGGLFLDQAAEHARLFGAQGWVQRQGAVGGFYGSG